MDFWPMNLHTTTLALLIAFGHSASHVEVPWSSVTYGPDGPWHAVAVKVGGVNSPGTTQVDLFAGGTYGSFILTEDSCSAYTDTTCGKGGTWHPEYESDTDTGYEAQWRLNNSADSTLGAGETYVQAMTINGLTVANVPLVAIGDYAMMSPGGTMYGTECGTLALGTSSPTQIQVFETAKTSNNSWGFEYPDALYNEIIIPSYSWMIHIVSASLNYEGSLILGGYDKGRTIGPSLNSSAALTLIDIGLGVERGGSPFSAGFKSMTGLLVNSTGEPTTLNVLVETLMPYLYLPAKSCEKLSEVLPLTYDTTLRYYLWNTEDSSYEAIISSPSYLSFVFDDTSGASANVTIKVPLMLLNLTLSPPLIQKETQYFPCLDYAYDGAGTYRFGRAFLQSAFLGFNYNTYTGWLGQAAGLGLGKDRLDIADGTHDIETHEDNGTILFDSWRGYWTPLAEDSSVSAMPSASVTANSEVKSSSRGLATGAIVGIIVGAICTFLFLIGGLICWKKQKRGAVNSDRQVEEVNIVELSSKCLFGCPHGKIHRQECLHSHSYIPKEPVELYATEAYHELAGSTTFPPRGLDGR